MAILGDQGLSSNSTDVLRMIKSWDVDILLIAGDFDYRDNPLAFIQQNTDELGRDFPILAVPGNHDVLMWFEPHIGYKAILERQNLRSGMDEYCQGELGVKSFCIFDNIVSK